MGIRICIVVMAAVFIFSGLDSALMAAEGQNEKGQMKGAALSNADCIKCHPGVVNDIETAGQAHKTEIGCMDCHNGHPPMNYEIIPQCSDCHSGEPHFELPKCLQCHSNPHRPLELKLAKDITGPCLTCHAEQGEQLKSQKSFHQKLACTACHNRHGQVPECLQCHKPHSETMTNGDCGKCHGNAHTPLTLAYKEDLDSRLCASCHGDIYASIKANPSKHSGVECAKCHKNQHGMVPRCQDCHGEPHPQGILQKFGSCLDCHYNPHDLDNWASGSDAKGGKKKAKKGKK